MCDQLSYGLDVLQKVPLWAVMQRPLKCERHKYKYLNAYQPKDMKSWLANSSLTIVLYFSVCLGVLHREDSSVVSLGWRRWWAPPGQQSCGFKQRAHQEILLPAHKWYLEALVGDSDSKRTNEMQKLWLKVNVLNVLWTPQRPQQLWVKLRHIHSSFVLLCVCCLNKM